MNKLTSIKNFIVRNFPAVGIVLAWLVLLIANYTPGAYLLGWDNLQTELNPALAVKRAFFSGWQEYQSLGLPAGMGHAADLMRSVILWFASFVIPQNMIRYGFQMSMVLVGALGMLQLLKSAGFDKDPSAGSGQGKQGFAFIGAIAYILNYNVIQMMFLPYESFSIFMGMLPWEIWAFLRIVDKNKLSKKDWLIFFIVFLLATSQAQALQLFVVLGFVLFLMTIGLSIRKNPLKIFKRAFLAAMMIFVINSFWLLPQLYFLKTSSSVVTTAKINQLSTEDILYRNKDKGNLKDFLTNTGFFNDGVDHNQQELFGTWRAHRDAVPVLIVMYLLAFVSLMGIFPRSKYRLPFVFLYILVVISLLNNTWPLDLLNTLIRKNSFINQIFRSPFTKFSILYALVSSYFLTNGVYFIAKNLSREKVHALYNSGLSRIKPKFNTSRFETTETGFGATIRNAFVVLFMALIIFQALPAFTGNYFAPQMKLSIPKSYFSLFDYFKTVDKNKRIALLPEYTHWGWFFNNWGYDGSGFLWYGIEQPIISRNFDMWSTKGEGYYWEIKAALEKEDLVAVENVLEKYGVDYMIFDHSISPVVSSSKAIQNSRVEEMLQKSRKISVEKKFEFLTVYKVNHDKKIQDFVWTTGGLPNIGPNIDVTNEDTAYTQNGNYRSDPDKQYQIYYPFLDMTTQTNLKDKEWSMSESSAQWVFTRKLPFDFKLPQKQADEKIVLYKDGFAVNYSLPYTINIDNNLLTVTFPKIQISSFKPSGAALRYCVTKNGNIPSSQQGNTLRIDAENGDYICTSYDDINLDQKYGYIVKIENKNISGQRPFFYALDKTKDQSYIEDRLSSDTQYYILGDRYPSGMGYSYALQSNSYKTIPSVNEITGLSVYLMPYDSLKGLSIKIASSDMPKAAPSNNFEAKKETYYKYTVELKNGDKTPKTIVLNQAYHQGWHAYELADSKWQMANGIKQTFPFIFGKEIKNHVMVNNWENGWVMDDKQMANGKWQMAIVYLPQYLEYIGFGLLILTIGIIFFNTKTAKLRKLFKPMHKEN